MTRQNWGGTLTYEATTVARPSSVDELRELVLRSPSVKALGTRHSFSPVADAPGGVQVDLSRLPSEIVMRPAEGLVTIGPATTYGELLPILARHDRSLPALASLPHCTVAGSVATGTHGSGSSVRALSDSVAALDLLDGTGQVRTFGRDDASFDGVVVNIGALGIVTGLTLRTVPAYEVRQTVYEPVGWDAVEEHACEILDAAYSASIFTRWVGDTAGHVVLKSRTTDGDPPAELFGSAPIAEARHPAHRSGAEPVGVTEQLGVPGPAGDRLPHFRLGFTPSAGAEVQSEYFIDRADAEAAIRALHAVGPVLQDLLLVSEIRTVAADEQWLSPAHGRDTMGFHFTWRPDHAGVQALAPHLERALAPFAPRPHWGKVFAMPGPLDCYPALQRFARLRDDLDPSERFLTPFVRDVLGTPVES